MPVKTDVCESDSARKKKKKENKVKAPQMLKKKNNKVKTKKSCHTDLPNQLAFISTANAHTTTCSRMQSE